MMKMTRVWVELYQENDAVTRPYLCAIAAAFRRMGYPVGFYRNGEPYPGQKNDIYVVALSTSVLKLWLRGRRDIVLWAQGIWPEESRLRHGSRIRFEICSLIERYTLVKANRIFLVSGSQRDFYREKYHLNLDDKVYIMPCSNETIHEEAFYVQGKYDHLTFVYAGSMSPYQCVDEMLRVFHQVEQTYENARLLFYTGDPEKARERVEAIGVRNVVVDYAVPDQLSQVISSAKYGFVIRNDIAVNRVATPTKLSTYIANGIIPVYSSCLDAFEESARGIIRLPYREESFLQDLADMEAQDLDAHEIYVMYQEYFMRNYSYDNGETDMQHFLSSIYENHSTED